MNISESTHDEIMETCYPDLNKALVAAELDEEELDYSEKGCDQIRKAVQVERTRLRDSHPPAKKTETELGREIQKQTGAPSVLVNRIVREGAKKRLQTTEGEGKKPN